MDANSTVIMTDKILSALGVARSDIDVITLAFMGVIVVSYYLFRHKCKSVVNCGRAEKALLQLESISDKMTAMHDLHVVNHEKLGRFDGDHSDFESSLSELKTDMTLLRGIITGMNTGSSSNKRIIHEQ